MSRILIVDDFRPLVHTMERALRRAGFEVVTGYDGAAALAAIEASDFDAAVVDYDIPFVDGIAVLTRLLELQPGAVRVLASGSLDLEAAIGAVNRGAVSQVLSKPFSTVDLVHSVQEALAVRDRMGAHFASARDREHTCELGRITECLESDALQLAVQPILSASDGEIVAYEALLRSTHPELPGPAAVLRAVETHDLVDRLGSVVASRAAGWCERLSPHVRLFINLHPYELSDPESLCQRLEPLEAYSDRVVLEITERSCVLDVEARGRSIAALRERGFTLAVDDLGAGYNSLAVLAELRPRIIKVDMSIVRDIDRDQNKQRLMELVCQFGMATGADVVAEGIETHREAQTVRSCGVSLLQGYLFGKPSMTLPAPVADSSSHSVPLLKLARLS